MLSFEIIWRHIIAVAMNPYCVVKGFNIFKYKPVRMCVIPDFETVNPFSFDERMEGCLNF